MNALDGLIRAELLTYVLECVRCAGVIIAAPLAWTAAPVRVRVVLILLLGLTAHGIVSHVHVPSGVVETGWLISSEFAVGIALGLVVRFSLASIEIAGELLGPMIGISAAAVFDPLTHDSHGPVYSVLRQLAVLLAVVVGLHRVVISALIEGFRVLPVGTLVAPGQAFPGLLELTSQALSLGARVALPMAAVLFMTQLSLAFIARAAPQMQVFNVGFAVTLAVGLSIMFMTLPDIGRTMLVDYTHIGTRLEDVFRSLGVQS